MLCSYNSILTQLWSIVFQLGILKIIQAPTVIALILCIVGATSASNPATIEAETTVHVGIILYLVVWIMLAILTIIAACDRHKVPDQERILVIVIALALPLILVHIVYSLCAAFSHILSFNPVTGSSTISLLMSVLEEMLVVLLYIIAGLKMRCTPLPEDSSGARQLGYRFGRGDFGTGKLGILTLGLGVANAFRSRKETMSQERQPRTHQSTYHSNHQRKHESNPERRGSYRREMGSFPEQRRSEQSRPQSLQK